MTLLSTRMTRARSIMADAGIGALAFVPGPNFSYLTGVHLHLMERATLFVLTCEGGCLAVMPSLERQKWSAAMPEAETFYWTDAEGPSNAIAALAKAIGTDTPLGIEGLRMRAAEYLALLRHWDAAAIIDADLVLAELRLLKDATEISELRRAIGISESALGEVHHAGIGGRSEAEITARLKSAMLAHGATGFAFDPIVLTGANSANPHGSPGDRVVQPGDALLIDFGASFGNMHADITRTVFCAHASDDHARLYETIATANAAGKAAAMPANKIGDVDAAATDVLSAAGYSELILHKTGHGLGREVHEAPQVARANGAPQRPGMVFTVEPGLYREAEVGIRIEDNILITEDGHECLTSYTKELLTLA
ncbi:Xaa-Pro peptidase family protein [Roseivivax sp. GX 12232]|uniref:M24 family metallopeptidase n=1 Tax=Roseivivax sp. GX 12232 TaxID=2900547 RepID=UPI001E591378|nr:Xaa-Pro peptidase family protein [Roseivivax sp. GX 12232]MCE0507314.1 Xaa-Pro peptidase family protein [Roseivivax sp. GX 12232]